MGVTTSVERCSKVGHDNYLVTFASGPRYYVKQKLDVGMNGTLTTTKDTHIFMVGRDTYALIPIYEYELREEDSSDEEIGKLDKSNALLALQYEKLKKKNVDLQKKLLDFSQQGMKLEKENLDHQNELHDARQQIMRLKMENLGLRTYLRDAQDRIVHYEAYSELQQ